MIRIDEIYSNIFVPLIQSRSGQCSHFFDPFGRTDFDSLCQLPYIEEMSRNFLFWDQEPIHLDVHQDTLDRFADTFRSRRTTLVTSEKDSEFVDAVCERYGWDRDYYFFHGWACLDWYRGYNRILTYTPFRDRTPEYTFLCPNNIIGGKRRHRLELLNELVDRELVEDNLISFPAVCPYENRDVKDLCREYDIPLGHVELPLVIDHGAHHAGNSHQVDMWSLANQSLLHIVTETVYQERRHHLTEKTFKPIVMQQPFVLVSCQGSLEYLRSYGFRTFGELWNEDYDEYNDDVRIMRIGKLLSDLHNMTPKEKQQLHRHLIPIVEHNFQWFYSQGFEDLLWNELSTMAASW
jgi:hypothetical protein